ncbi:uncharacterized protein PGTG_04207 [Puccinia graminis f. sp. tritici CRL 75-36-700-3]|uniref:Sister chromatid cohesion protein PDS5 n=1 Tax=Puccinia graminis f. sp. tritici (strain CRL 75-36-700-3 / race SCCL) TaxID=418459 RepID=E3K1S6_PUCGT|nr:uncharacterized protein PGTG_04207 [Puccinia graminis f. sp. tritici CRL 75-36-700-3]EFP78251.2 hypothetical protein PGTG_04207 [Puccinia graminis f. sp. tritici CRL 75-36-700-3]
MPTTMDSSEASQPLSQRLKFKGTLAKDSKVAANELIKRLTGLLDELKEFDQEAVDRDSLSAVRAELIQPILIVHKDKTVKALVACCIANLLRLYAPDAPYTLPELRDIFQFFFRQIRNLQPGSSQCPNQAHYLHLLESLANVQSIVLVCDVPQSEELITEIFEVLFKMVNTEMSQNFLLLFADLSVQIINAASPIIPPSVVKLLLEQFKPKQVKSNPAAYRLAIDICNACEDRLKQDAYRYFNDLLIQASKAAGFDHDNSDDSENEESDTDRRTRKSFTELEATHNLITSVYQVCPGLLQSVIPQLEAELKKDQVQLRVLAVQTLGQMFSEQSFSSIPSAQTLKSLASTTLGPTNQSTFYINQPLGTDLARRYSSTWREWTRRAKDLSPQVRLAVVSCLKQIISKQPHLNDDISALFKTCLTDADEKIRCETCKVFSQLEFELVLHHLDVGILKTLSGRIEDRKPSVQREALNALGRLYKLAQSAIEAENPQAITQFAWIPQEILSSMFVGDPRLCASAEKVFLEYVAPFPSTTAEKDRWVDRLLNITKYLDSTSMMKLRKFSRIGVKRPTGFDRFLDACEVYNGGVMNQNETQVRTRLADIMRVLSNHFPDSAKALEELHSFAKLNDRRLYKLFKTMSDEKADLPTLIKTHQEFRRKLKPLSPSFAETLEIFLHKSAYLVANSASVPILLERVKHMEADDLAMGPVDVQPNLPRSTSNAAKTLLEMISTDRPAMLMMHVDTIVESLSDLSESNTNQALADACLLVLSSIAKSDPTVIPSHNDIIASMKHFPKNGTPLQAKQAAIVLVKVKGMTTACREVHEDLVECLPKAPPDRLLSYLSTLGQIVKYAPKFYERHETALTTFLLNKQILTSTRGDQEDDDDWIPDDQLCDSNRARISALKVLVNRCIASANSPQADTISAPIFKLLWQLIVTRAKIGPAIHSYAVAARLRLKAAESIIKLATYISFNKEIQKHFGKLVWVSQDTSGFVRDRFYRKLARYLQSRRLDHPRFNVLMYLAAPDPLKEVKDIALKSITSRLSITGPQMRTQMFETTILYLLHALAHHDDFGTETRDLENFTIYIDFFVESVGNSENASLLYHLAGQLKTVKDRQDNKYPEALYMLSDLAQLVIRAKARDHHWVLPTYPGHVKLPDDLFKGLSSEEALEVSKKDYLPEEFVKKFSLTKIHAIQKEREAMINGEPVGPGSRKTKRGPKPTKKQAPEKKRRKLATPQEDDEADQDDESEPEIIVAPKEDRSKRLAARRRPPARAGHKSQSEVNTTDSEQ